MDFSGRFRELRKSRGFSQIYMANYMNVSQVTISNWERGVKEPGFKSLIDLAILFGVSCDYLLGADDEK